MPDKNIPVPSSPGSGGGENPHRDPLEGWARAVHKIEPCGCGVYFDYVKGAMFGPPTWNDEDLKLFHCDAHRCDAAESKVLDEGCELPESRPLPMFEDEPTPTEIAKRFSVVLKNGLSWHDGDAQAIIADVLVNTRHLADALGVDFFKELDNSYEYYSAEVRRFGTAKGEGL